MDTRLSAGLASILTGGGAARGGPSATGPGLPSALNADPRSRGDGAGRVADGGNRFADLLERSREPRSADAPRTTPQPRQAERPRAAEPEPERTSPRTAEAVREPTREPARTPDARTDRRPGDAARRDETPEPETGTESGTVDRAGSRPPARRSPPGGRTVGGRVGEATPPPGTAAGTAIGGAPTAGDENAVDGPRTSRRGPPGPQDPAASDAAGLAGNMGVAQGMQTAAAARPEGPATALESPVVGGGREAASVGAPATAVAGTTPAPNEPALGVPGAAAPLGPGGAAAIAPAGTDQATDLDARLPSAVPSAGRAAEAVGRAGRPDDLARTVAASVAARAAGTDADAADAAGGPAPRFVAALSEAAAAIAGAPGPNAAVLAAPVAGPATTPPGFGTVDGLGLVSATVDAPVDSPAFTPALAAQVTLLARDGVQRAELRLNPAEMGPVSVQIVVDGSQARIDFVADSAQTRQSIEGGLPTLASALRDAGLTLAGGGVFQQPRDTRGDGRGRDPDDGGGARRWRVELSAPGTAPAAARRTDPGRALDVYA